MRFHEALTEAEAQLACEIINTSRAGGPVARPETLQFFGGDYLLAQMRRARRFLNADGVAVMEALKAKVVA